MRPNKLDNDWHRAVHLVAAGEVRVKTQRELVKKLKRQGRSTASAESLLVKFERTQLQMRNYLQLLELLRLKDRYAD
jgi:hypothetical protein